MAINETAQGAAFKFLVDGRDGIETIRQLQGEVKKLNEANVDKVADGFRNLGSLAKGLLPAIGAVQIKDFFVSSVQLVDQLGDAAERAQLSVESFSRLQFIAQKTDVEFGELTNAIKKYQQGLSDAAQGQGPVLDGLNALGLSAATLRRLSIEDQLAAIANEFNKLSDPTDRARVAQDLFSKSGAALIPLLKRGSEGIKELSAAAEEMGAVVDSRAAAGIDKLTKSFGSFFSTLKLGIGQGIGNIYADIFGSGDELLDLEKRIEGLRQAQERLQRGIYVASEDPATALDNINKQIDALEPRLGRLRELQNLTSGGNSISSGMSNRRNARPDELKEIDIGSIQALKIQQDEYAKVMAQIDAERIKRQEDWRALQIDSANDVAASIRSIEQENFRDSTDEFERELRRRNELSEQYKKYEAEKEEELQEALTRTRQQGTNAAISLLSAYGGKFAGIAKVILAWEAAMSIKGIIMDTHKAMMKCIADYGVPWGYAAAAGVAVYGAARVAAVASTVGGSSAGSVGSPSNPVFTQPGSTDTGSTSQRAGDEGQRVVQLVVNGNVYSGKESVSWFIERLQEAVNQNDVVIFNPESRQARELVGNAA